MAVAGVSRKSLLEGREEEALLMSFSLRPTFLCSRQVEHREHLCNMSHTGQPPGCTVVIPEPPSPP